jgi:hypothetical protein
MTDNGLFDAAIWGTVGQWFSAIATLSLGALSLYFSRSGERRARRVEREQAIRSVAFVLHTTMLKTREPRGELILMNAGSAPFTNIQTTFPARNPANGEVVDAMTGEPALGPGSEIKIQLDRFAIIEQNVYRVELTDVHGTRWWRQTDGTFGEVQRAQAVSRSRRLWGWWRRDR